MPAAKPSTVADYLAQQPPERRKELQRVRSVVKKHLPAGYQEILTSGMIAWVVPLERYPDTYNRQALWYAGLAANKGGFSLHLVNVYGSPPLEKKLRDGFAAAGKKLDMGKACIRFKRAEDLALDAVAEVVAATPLDRYVAAAQARRR
jgi:uncharacterized protein YdhG (YjbR/CyaY superfamily)